jgi:putative tricarboxylic transport membrane protein
MWTFVERPISAVLLVFAVLLLIVAVLPAIRKGREEAFVE